MRDNLLKDQLAESGLEMQILGAILGIGSAILGGVGQASQAREQAAAQNEAAERQFKYDTQAWEYSKQRINADYRHSLNQWQLNTRNEDLRAYFQDETNIRDWQYRMKIQDFEYRSLMKQYAKSNEIYSQQLGYNRMAAEAAKEAEYRKLQDATSELAFKNQDIVIQAMNAQGTAAVKGQQGRSANKSAQAVFASLGRSQAILTESLLSAKADTSAAMKKIAADKYGADIAAQAARMLKPERAPQSPPPLRTPRAEFLQPRAPQEFDYGPEPIKGAMASGSSTGAWLGAAAQALPSIGGLIGGLSGGGGGYRSPYSFSGASNQTALAYSGIKLF